MAGGLKGVLRTSNQPYITQLHTVTINNATVPGQISGNISGSATTVTGATQDAITSMPNLTQIGNGGKVSANGSLIVSGNTTLNGSITTSNLNVLGKITTYDSISGFQGSLALVYYLDGAVIFDGMVNVVFSTSEGGTYCYSVTGIYASNDPTTNVFLDDGNYYQNNSVSILYDSIDGVYQWLINQSGINLSSLPGLGITAVEYQFSDSTYLGTGGPLISYCTDAATQNWVDISDGVSYTLTPITTSQSLFVSNSSNVVVTNAGFSPSLVVSQAEIGSGVVADFYETTMSPTIPRMRIAKGGNVGINTASPSSSYALDINGSASFNDIHVVGDLTVTGTITVQNIATKSYVDTTLATIGATYKNTKTIIDSCNVALTNTIDVLPVTCNLATITTANACNTALTNQLNAIQFATTSYLDQQCPPGNYGSTAVDTFLSPYLAPYATLSNINASNTEWYSQMSVAPSSNGWLNASNVNAYQAGFLGKLPSLPTTCNISTVSNLNAQLPNAGVFYTQWIATPGVSTITRSDVDAMYASIYVASNTIAHDVSTTYVNSCNTSLLTQIYNLPSLCNLATTEYFSACNTALTTQLNALPTSANLVTFSNFNTSNTTLVSNLNSVATACNTNFIGVINASNASISTSMGGFGSLVVGTPATIAYIDSCNTAVLSAISTLPTTCNLATSSYVSTTLPSLSSLYSSTSNYVNVATYNASNASLSTKLYSLPATCNLATTTYVNTEYNSVASQTTSLPTTPATLSACNLMTGAVYSACNSALNAKLVEIPTTCNLANTTYLNACNVALNTRMTALISSCNLVTTTYVNSNVAGSVSATAGLNMSTQTDINSYASNWNVQLNALSTNSNLATPSYVTALTSLPNLTSVGAIGTTTTINGDLNASNLTVFGNQMTIASFDSQKSNLTINNYSGYSAGISVYQNALTGGAVASFYDNDVSTTVPVLQVGSNGNVGLGTTNPQYNLDVNGIARIQNNLTISALGSLSVGAGGSITAPTLATGTANTNAATTAFVTNAVSTATTTLSSTYAPLASPGFTGVPTVPTATAGTNNTQIATTAFVNTAISNAVTATSAYITSSNNTWTANQTFNIPIYASNIGFRNRLHNGNMFIDQRCSSNTPITVGSNVLIGAQSGYSVDRFATQVTGSGGKIMVGQVGLTNTDQETIGSDLLKNAVSVGTLPTNSLMSYLSMNNSLTDPYSFLTSPSGVPLYSTNARIGSHCLDCSVNTAGGTATNYGFLTLSQFPSLPVTISMWVNPLSITGSTQDIFCFGRPTKSGLELYITSTGALKLGVYFGTVTDYGVTTSASIMAANTWYNICITVPQAGQPIIYLNGTSVGTGTTTSSTGTIMCTNGVTTTQLSLGAYGGVQTAFKGYIDDFRMYNRILTSTEIALLTGSVGIPASPSSTSLKSQYTFEGNLTDAMASVNMTATGTMKYVPGYVTGGTKALYLANEANVVATPTRAANQAYQNSFNMTTYTSITVTGWFNFTKLPQAANTWSTIWEFGTTTTEYLQLTSYYASATTAIVYPWAATGSTANGFTVNANTWYHFALAWVSSTSLAFFVNGALVSTIASGVGAGASSVTFNVGESPTTSLSRPFAGYVDDLRIYTRILSPYEIQGLYYGSLPNASIMFQQTIEGFNTGDLAWGTSNALPVTASCWLKNNAQTAQSFTMSLNNSANMYMYMPFENSVTDVAGSSPVVTTGTITYTTAKIGAACVSFSGNTAGSTPTNYISYGLNNLNVQNGFTFSLWFYATTLVNYQCILNMLTSSGNGIDITANTTGVTIGVTTVGGATTPSIVTNRWYHMVGTITSAGLTFYFNGVSQGLKAYAFTAPFTTLFIGGQGTPSLSMSNAFSGYVDDFRIYNGVLSATQITNLYNYSIFSPNTVYSYSSSAANNIVLYAPMDGSVTDTISSTSVTTTGSVSYTTGKVGNAVSFSGNTAGTTASNYLRYAISQSPTFTVSLWFTLTTLVNYQCVMSMVAASGNGIDLTVSNGSGNVMLNVTGGGATTGTIPTLSTNQWCHVVGVISSSGLTFYCNGSLVGSRSYAYSSTFTSLYLAGGPIAGGNGFSGLVDEMRIYATALTDVQISQLYNNTLAGNVAISYNISIASSSQPPIMYFPFENSVTDLMGNTTASVVGAPTYGSASTAMVGTYSIYFNNIKTAYATQYVDLSSSISLLNLQNITFSAWAYLTTSDNNGDPWQPCVFMIGDWPWNSGNSSGTGYSTGININNGGGIIFNFTTMNNGQQYINGGVMNTNTWYHVAITYNGSTFTAYVNGSSAGTVNATGNIVTNTQANNGTNFFRIGDGGATATTNKTGWAGYIDDFRVYNRVLGATEISQIYRNQLVTYSPYMVPRTVLYNTPSIAAGAWQKVSFSVPGDIFGYSPVDNNGSLTWGVCLGASSTYANANTVSASASNNTIGVWNNTSNMICYTGSTTQIYGASSNNFLADPLASLYITGAQVEIGTMATQFDNRSFTSELALCQRYFESTYEYGTALGTATQLGSVGWCIGASNAVGDTKPRHTVPYGTQKRTTPTITVYNPTSGAVGTAQNTDAVTAGAVSLSNISASGYKVSWNSGNSGQAIGNEIMMHYTASADF